MIAEAIPSLEKKTKHDIAAVIDRLVLKGDVSERLTDSVEGALKLGFIRSAAQQCWHHRIEVVHGHHGRHIWPTLLAAPGRGLVAALPIGIGYRFY